MNLLTFFADSFLDKISAVKREHVLIDRKCWHISGLTLILVVSLKPFTHFFFDRATPSPHASPQKSLRDVMEEESKSSSPRRDGLFAGQPSSGKQSIPGAGARKRLRYFFILGGTLCRSWVNWRSTNTLTGNVHRPFVFESASVRILFAYKDIVRFYR